MVAERYPTSKQDPNEILPFAPPRGNHRWVKGNHSNQWIVDELQEPTRLHLLPHSLSRAAQGCGDLYPHTESSSLAIQPQYVALRWRGLGAGHAHACLLNFLSKGIVLDRNRSVRIRA